MPIYRSGIIRPRSAVEKKRKAGPPAAAQGGSTTESYTYDPVGNRTASLGVSSYTTNASNEMTANSNASYTYDSNGNTLTKVVGSNTTTYAWDYENRLASVTLPGSGGTVNFKYDPFGRRIYKSVSTGGTSVFAYDGDNLIEDTNSSGTAVARYSQTENIDEPLAMLRSSATSYYNADGLGSVTSLANGSGTLTQSYTFDSFGNTTSTGSVVNPFQYTGREFDSETGLYYYRARYYDPSSGKFLTEDPLDFDGDGTNFYDYALNDPNVFVDPFGLWHCVADADCNFTPEFKKGLDRFQQCIGKTEVIITSGRRPPTPRAGGPAFEVEVGVPNP